MSIKQQAMFWLKNVNDYHGATGDSSPLAEGYLAFSNLMKTINGDYRSYETSTAESIRTKIGIMADDLENYHHLTDTVDCLYQMVSVGLLCEEGSISYLAVEKPRFKGAFKASVAVPFQMLENYGFYFRYAKNGKEASVFKNCDTFFLFSDLNSVLIPAMKHLVSLLPALDAKLDYIGKQNLLFSLSDFESILSKGSTRQGDIPLLKPGIINTAGDKGELWHYMAQELMSHMQLDTRAYINPYVFPNWTVKLLYKKKTIVTFHISPDTVSVNLPLSYAVAKRVITNREKMPDIVNRSIDKFGCMGCGKCLSKNGIEIFEGVPLCGREASNNMGESPRGIRGSIASLEEAKTICQLVKELVL